MSRLRSGPLALLLGCLAAVGVVACGVLDGSPATVQVGSPAPELELPTLDGSEVDLRSFAGSRVVLSFWATWCQPCRGEIPELNELHRTPGVEVIAVALDTDGPAPVQAFVEGQGIEYTVLLGNQKVFERFRGFTIPYTLVLDDSLQIEKIYRGPIDTAELETIATLSPSLRLPDTSKGAP